jgi:hypothetical protein
MNGRRTALGAAIGQLQLDAAPALSCSFADAEAGVTAAIVRASSTRPTSRVGLGESGSSTRYRMPVSRPALRGPGIAVEKRHLHSAGEERPGGGRASGRNGAASGPLTAAPGEQSPRLQDARLSEASRSRGVTTRARCARQGDPSRRLWHSAPRIHSVPAESARAVLSRVGCLLGTRIRTDRCDNN